MSTESPAGHIMLRPLVSQSTHCHAWSTDGRYQGTRRLTVQDRRMLTAQGWTMTLVRRLVTGVALQKLVSLPVRARC